MGGSIPPNIHTFAMQQQIKQNKDKMAAPEPAPVQPTYDARRRTAATRSRRVGRPLLGPGGARRDEGLQTTLGAG
jgi:hypothetical protein